jgi:Fe2+ or Zn2+ uptake regulation protein
MQDTSLSSHEIVEALRERGYRLTSPRRAIADAIMSFERAFTAEDVVQHLDVSDPSVGRATVFRTLDVLVSLRLLDRLHAADGCHSYVLAHSRSRHYHHLICNSCGTVVPFESCNIESLYPTVSAQTDFQISGHMLELFGLCGACRA